MMAIGYACLTDGSKDINYKTCRIRNANPENLYNIIDNNLNSLEKAIDYNYKNDIKLFRINSDIIPFGSNKQISINWKKIFKNKLKIIGKKIKKYKIRVTMHPGQYTVINSLDKKIVQNSVNDLIYHTDFLQSISTNNKSKLILHIGGIYNNKQESINRFIKEYKKLPKKIKKRLVIENDDKSYNINDILNISKIIKVPVVYDNLHNKINFFDPSKSDEYWIKKCSKTWKRKDGIQKIHYSQQAEDKKTGSHSSTIDVKDFIKFYKSISNFKLDIMLEVKDKDLSAIKCINEIKKIKTI